MPERPKRGCFGRLIAGVTWLLVLAALAGGGLLGYLYLTPYRSPQSETFVVIDRGLSSRAIARRLEQQGIVRSEWAFLAARLLHPGVTLQAGEYRFGAQQTPGEIFDKIRRGEIFYREITVPEGSNMFDIAELLRNAQTVSPDAFLKAAADPASIRDLDRNAPSLEGFLFPSKYRLTHQTTARQLCRMMTDEFRRQWKEQGGDKQADKAHRIVIVASLVEKESAAPEERPQVASVFFNRLRLSMPLQCDPTTVYAALLENRYRGTIYKSDLASKSLYNTYSHAGLPPGPIANAGSASLRAALYPVDTGYLYFVAKPKGAGTHVFSSTLAAHEKAVREYRRGAR